MKKLSLLLTVLCISLGSCAQTETTYKEKRPYSQWVKMVPKLDADFYHTKEAIRIAENVLLYQHTTGGWPKNIYMPAELSEQEKKEVIAQKDNVNESTIDNDATYTEMLYLSHVYNATKDERYKQAVLDGIQYILNAQYPNGGWPQFWPRPKGYYTAITYNDDAMVNVMEVLRDVYEGKAPYGFVPDSYRDNVRAAFDKGVECIVNTQVKQNGKLTVWCAQHDPVTLEPVKARAYELPSLSGQESDNIVLLLMSIPHPSPEVITAIESAVEWFNNSKVEGIKKEYFTDENGKKDYKMVECTDCPPLWARFYDLETNEPIFSGRDGSKKYDVSEIEHERRNGYSWYNSDGLKVLKRYEEWKKEHKR